jgi:hypothetical protein
VSEPINDGGPAYPVSGPNGDHPGMSLRDYFAAKAMPAIMMAADQAFIAGHRGDRVPTLNEYAKDAYRIADAMLKAREQQT